MNRNALIAVFSLLFSSVSYASIVVQYSSTQGGPFSTWGSYLVDGSNNVSIADAPTFGWMRIYSTNPTNEDIGWISIAGTGDGSLNVLLSPNASSFSPAARFPSIACRNWRGITGGNRVVKFQGRIGGDLDAPAPELGGVNVNHIVRLDVDGSIKRVVSQSGNGSPAPLISAITAGGNLESGITVTRGSIELVRMDGSVTSSGVISIVQDGATITRVQVAGNFAGQIIAASILTTEGGSIGTVDVTGDLSHTTPSQVRIRAKNGVGSIKARSISASITTNDDGNGNLGRLETTGTVVNGETIVPGPFSANLRCYALDGVGPDQGIIINGDVTGELGCRAGGFQENITIKGSVTSTGSIRALSGGSMGANTTIVIRDSMSGEIEMSTAASLNRQIIINAANNTTTPGTWTGPVKIGPSGNQIILDDGATQPYLAPYYAAISSTLGGGAVGLVPYGLHKEDCSPPHAPDGGCGLQYSMRTWPASLDGGSRQTIVLRHYGPVLNDSGLSPCLLERLAITCPYPIACPGPWEEVLSTTLPIEPAYQVYLPPEYPREVWVALKMNNGQPVKFHPNYTYRVSLISDGGVTRLRSAGTLASTAPGIVGYPYEYKPLCADVNLDSLINPGDIDAWMEQPADVDSSGEINLDDLVRLIEVVGM